jgi:hypothetical protein
MILPIVLIISTVSAMVIIALANYVTVDIRYGKVVEERADRLAAADGGLRYGVEQLRNFHGQLGALCNTAAATGGGYTQQFPPMINGADTKVTCRRTGNLISDLDGWGLVVTGEGVPNGQFLFATKGAGQSENLKTFSGPVYISDPTRMDMGAKMEIDDGDLYYSSTDCTVPLTIPAIATGYLAFVPDFFRGVECADLPWTGLFNPPKVLVAGNEVAPTPPTNVPVPPVTGSDGCTVFSPGKYTSLALGNDNYFKAGEYYFENVDITIQNATVVAGFPYGAGDSAKIDQPVCKAQQDLDAGLNAAGGGGATFYLGGSSKISVLNGGGFEIFRRLINRTYLSIYTLGTSGTNYIASTLDWNDAGNGWVLETKSGSNNDVAVHGLFWAPKAAASLGNITNAANGQLLGGLVVARLDTQASASASAFSIGIETSPRDAKFLLSSTATLYGHSTTIQAVVQFRPTSSELAINSWRVVN